MKMSLFTNSNRLMFVMFLFLLLVPTKDVTNDFDVVIASVAVLKVQMLECLY